MEGFELHSTTPPPPQAANDSNQLRADREPPEKRQRLTRGDGRKVVSYDMKLHPMDDILRPTYSAKRRGIKKEVSRESSNGDGAIEEDDKGNSPSGEVVAPNVSRRRSSRNFHQSEKPIYSAKWHPLDQMLKKNAHSSTFAKKDDGSKRIRKESMDSSSTLKDQEDPTAVKFTFALDEDAEMPSSLCRRRSARVSSSKHTPPNYDMK